MNNKDSVRLQHIIDSCKAILQFVSNRKRADLDTDRMLLSAITRELEIIGEAVNALLEDFSIHDVDGLHQAIGLFLVNLKKDFSGEEVRFLRHEMLMSQHTLANLLGVSEQAVRRWERGKITIPKPSESLLRLLYREHIHNQENKISTMLKKIAALEDEGAESHIHFEDTPQGWKSAA